MPAQWRLSYVEPQLPVFLALGFLGYLMARLQLPFRGRRLLLLGLVGLVLLSSSPVAWLLSRPLEALFPNQPINGGAAQATVVPGSDFEDPIPGRPFAIPDRDTYGRCRLAAWIYHNIAPRPVLVSGHWATGVMRHILEAEGVPPEAIWEEKAAISTRENAVFSARILRDHGISTIILAEDATSMLRAEKCFEKEGLRVVPAVSRRYYIVPDLPHLLPRWEPIAANEETLHETAALLWYRLRGWI